MTPALIAVLTLWLSQVSAGVVNPNDLAHPGEKIVLDRGEHQGEVAFDHAAHIKARPDPQSRYKVTAAATCGGCHHTHDGKGVIQLAKCGGCHGPEGDPRNPKSQTFDEVNRKSGFHGLCIGCHESLAKVPATATSASRTGPVDCSDCHGAGPGGKG